MRQFGTKIYTSECIWRLDSAWTRWGILSAPPDPLAAIRGKEGEGGKRKERRGGEKVRERGRGREEEKGMGEKGRKGGRL